MRDFYSSRRSNSEFPGGRRRPERANSSPKLFVLITGLLCVAGPLACSKSKPAGSAPEGVKTWPTAPVTLNVVDVAGSLALLQDAI